jgi:hypothetical protein
MDVESLWFSESLSNVEGMGKGFVPHHAGVQKFN